MKLSRRGVIGIILLMLLLGAAIFEIAISRSQFSVTDAETAMRFVEQHQSRLEELMKQAQGRYLAKDDVGFGDRQFFRRTGLRSIDGRGEDRIIAFSFDTPLEGSRFLYYCPEGEGRILEHIPIPSDKMYDTIPEEGIYIAGIGINGKGYLILEKLKDYWYFCDFNYPT